MPLVSDLDLEWHSVSVDECRKLVGVTNGLGWRGSDENILNLYLTGGKYEIKVCVCDGFLFRSFSGFRRFGFGFPLWLGAADLSVSRIGLALDRLLAYAKAEHMPLRFCQMNERQSQALLDWANSRNLDSASGWVENEDDADYIYDVSAFASYPGARFSRKRNWVRRFKRMYPHWEYTALSKENAQDALSVALTWFDEKEGGEAASSNSERTMIERVLSDVGSYPVFGGVLYADTCMPAAMLVASRTSDKVCDVHYEKGISEFVRRGAIPVINQEFALRSCLSGCSEINLEEDLGIAGLRSMKQSYFPKEKLIKRSIILSDAVSSR